jgi:hypothetical protein
MADVDSTIVRFVEVEAAGWMTVPGRLAPIGASQRTGAVDPEQSDDFPRSGRCDEKERTVEQPDLAQVAPTSGVRCVD